ncbi:MAG: non-homologous end-joining DNA ligase [Alphaproteobacteria bacterium]|nr:non-homologous end-joining DNA ligase [Alphaproteobacteria bacterium]
MVQSRTEKFGGRDIELSNLDKVFFPGDDITKGDVVDFYHRIGDVALPHYRDRPLTMQRFPDGIGSDGFFQKDAPHYFPDWIDTFELDKEGGTVRHVVCNSAATLVYLADQGLITPHLGLARIDQVDHPDRMIFDLDPSDDDFSKVQDAASGFRQLLDGLEIPSFVATTGSRGLHVVVALDRSVQFDDVRAIARRVASSLRDADASALTTEQRKSKRGARVFLDTGRNAYGQTAVAPYALRPIAGAPVATPLDWSEALSSNMHPQRYKMANIFRRLANKSDPWQEIGNFAVSAEELDRRLRRA